MRAYHNSRSEEFRSPFGALESGGEVTLAIDVYDVPEATVRLRTWTEGTGEEIFPMDCDWRGDHRRFTVTLRPESPRVIWYSFIINGAWGFEARYGAKPGSTGGEGRDYYGEEPPSFQITVYNRREVPAWYKNGIVYQIFPDRFHRGEDWEENARRAFADHKNGPDRRLVDWDEPVDYRKSPDGRIAGWDFYGGTLRGISEKLGYLRELGVSAIYLNPIFEAASNHRYDTGDFTKIDPMLGTEKDFTDLCRRAEEAGISIILDGVFNHTGCDSKYFNKYGNYDSVGAFQSEDSEYRTWYKFDDSPSGYSSWWGVDDLPDIDEDDPGYRRFIYKNKNSVVRRWLRAGAKGWRLDVADELPDDFIEGVKSAVIEEKGGDGLLLGEVWEDASNKISYGKPRRYLLGSELDCAMNYPLRDGALGYIMGDLNAPELAERLMSLWENYPHEAFYAALNLMGSHDRPRLMTLLGGAPAESDLSDAQRAAYRLKDGQRGLAKGRLWLTTLIQMTMPGVPSIYYGDEAGMEGYSDPYNRGAYPWGDEDGDATAIYKNAIALRKSLRVFTEGDFEPAAFGDEVFGFYRAMGDECAVTLINRSLKSEYTVRVPARGKNVREFLSGGAPEIKDGFVTVRLRQLGSAVLYFYGERGLAAPMEPGRGVLCHVTSLPGDNGPGTFKDCREFIDFLHKNGQKYWQILPLNPTDGYGSPYAGASAFAGNEALIGKSQEELEEEFERFSPGEEYGRFAAENGHWLPAYAMFRALRERYENLPWQNWAKKHRRYEKSLFDDEKLRKRAEFYEFVQFKFEREWNTVRAYAREKGIYIIGDIPFYVSADSADVWTSPEMFALGEDMRPALEAGCPPDIFSVEGQKWGNPIYNWEAIRKDGYGWWIRRMKRAFDLYDFVRLDHFRGFEQYWEVPAGVSAKHGKWRTGPGMELFEAVYGALGELRITAEDLGFITPAVNALLARLGAMGTQVIQFYDGDALHDFRPNMGKIVYPGTHDSDTLLGWCEKSYPGLDPEAAAMHILRSVYTSGARIIITPLQDLFGLGNEARMNTPGTTGKNWSWQADREMFKKHSERIIKILRGN